MYRGFSSPAAVTAFSQHIGSPLVFAAEGNTIVARDSQSGALRYSSAALRRVVTCIAHTDPDHLWVGHDDGVMSVLSVHSLLPEAELVLHESSVTAISTVSAALPAQQLHNVVSVAMDGRLSLWHSASLRCIWCTMVVDGGILCCISLDSFVLCGSAIGTVHLVSPPSSLSNDGMSDASFSSRPPLAPSSLISVEGHNGPVRSLAVAKQEATASLWSGGDDGFLCKWELTRSLTGGGWSFSRSPSFRVKISSSPVMHLNMVNSIPHSILCTSSSEGLIRVDALRGAILDRLPVRSCPVAAVHASHDTYTRLWISGPQGGTEFLEVLQASSGTSTTRQTELAQQVQALEHQLLRQQSSIVSEEEQRETVLALRSDVSALRKDNLKLREQIQTLLRSPLHSQVPSRSNSPSSLEPSAAAQASERIALLEKQLADAIVELRDAKLAAAAAQQKEANSFELHTTRHLSELEKCYHNALESVQAAEFASRQSLSGFQESCRTRIENFCFDLRNDVVMKAQKQEATISSMKLLLDESQRAEKNLQRIVQTHQSDILDLQQQLSTQAEKRHETESLRVAVSGLEHEIRRRDIVIEQSSKQYSDLQAALEDVRKKKIESETRSSEDFNSLRHQLKSASEAATVLSQELQKSRDIRDEHHQMQTSYGVLCSNIAELEKERDDLQRRLSHQLALSDEYRTKWESAQASEEESFKKMESVRSGLEQRFQDTLRQMETETQRECTEKKKENAVLRDKNEHLLQKVERLEKLVDALKSESSIQAEQLLLRRDDRHKQGILEAAQANVEALQLELARQKTEVIRLSTERDHAAQARDLAEAELRKTRTLVKSEVSTMEAEVAALQRQLTDGVAQGERMRLLSENEDLKQQVQALRKELIQKRNDSKDIERKLEEQEVLYRGKHKTQQELITELEQQCEKYSSQLRVKDTQLSCLEQRIALKDAEWREQLGAAEQKHTAGVERLTTQLDRSQQEVAKLLQQLNESKDSVEEMKYDHRSKLRSLKADLEEQVANALRDAATLKSNLQQKSAEVLRLTEECAALSNRVDSRSISVETATEKKFIDQLAVKDDLIKELNARISAQAQVIARHHDDTMQLQTAVRTEKAAREEQQNTADQTIRKLQKELKQLAAESIQWMKGQENGESNELASMKVEVAQLKEQTDSLRKQLAMGEHSLKRKTEEVNTLLAKVTAMESEFTEKQLSVHREHEAVVKALRHELNASRQVVNTKDSDTIAAHEELEKAARLCRKLTNESTQLKAEVDDLQGQLEKATEKIRSLQRELDATRLLSQQLEEVTSERNLLQERLARISADATKAKSNTHVQELMVEELREQVSVYKAEAQALAERLQQQETKMASTKLEADRQRQLFEDLLVTSERQRQELEGLHAKHRTIVANLHAGELEYRQKIQLLQSQLAGGLPTSQAPLPSSRTSSHEDQEIEVEFDVEGRPPPRRTQVSASHTVQQHAAGSTAHPSYYAQTPAAQQLQRRHMDVSTPLSRLWHTADRSFSSKLMTVSSEASLRSTPPPVNLETFHRR